MPTISAVGKRRPVSTMTMRSSSSNTVMFLPISPSPPRGRTRSVPFVTYLSPGRLQQPVALQRAANDRSLALVDLDERQPHAPDRAAEHGQRGLHRRGARRAEHRAEDLGQRVVDLAPALGLVD